MAGGFEEYWMKIYIFEDNATTANNMKDAAESKGYEVIKAETIHEAFGLIANIQDEDIVSLDSQMPELGDGIKIAEEIRRSGIKCLILWHSSVQAPDSERLGIYLWPMPSQKWIEPNSVCSSDWRIKRDEYSYFGKKSFSHSSALSILCQGYLAAHGEIGLPKGIFISDEKKKLTLQQDWWKPVLGYELSGKELREEVKTMGKEATVITGEDGLLKAIKTSLLNGLKEDQIPEFTKKVFNAYEYLKTNVFSSNK